MKGKLHIIEQHSVPDHVLFGVAKELFNVAHSHGVFGSTLLSILCVSVFLVKKCFYWY